MYCYTEGKANTILYFLGEHNVKKKDEPHILGDLVQRILQ